jgi:signal transduction histidine kinase
VELTRLRETERWIAWVRAAGVAFAALQVALSTGYPPGYRTAAWIVTAVFAVGAALIWALARRPLDLRRARLLAIGALAFDVAVLSAYLLAYSWEAGSPIRQVLLLAVVEAAIRFGMVGPVVVTAATVPVLVEFERLRSHHSAPRHFRVDYVTFQIGTQLILGAIVGWLVHRLDLEAARAQARAGEAEELRDALGRRVDVLEAANRCARALGSSLELDEAFGAFVRELRGLLPFERTALILVEHDRAQVIATAGRGAEEVMPAGTARPIEGSVLESVLRGQVVYRRDMSDERFPEESHLVRLGLRSRLVAPLLLGARSVGALSIVREQSDAFSPEEIELVSLLGRLVATAVQNIRSYEGERRTVEELRRLSALRADFVSLVSHELRSPMAAVIGSARTLQQRWRQLSPEQREAFLALIGDETTRLAALIGDVLDTSRIEAGTFSYSFSDVDLGALVSESVAAARLAQDEVEVRAEVSEFLPTIRGDRERLRQVMLNLIDNAVKWSRSGDAVEVAARTDDGRVVVEVTDSGPGIPAEQQTLIFEKFGRADIGGGSVSGTGLGLFIARSIAEAHGGTLDVTSMPGEGATFVLALPVDGA